MANNTQYAEDFFRDNLKKGYSKAALAKMLQKKGVDKAKIKKAAQAVSPDDYEQEAVQYLRGLLQRNLDKGIPTSSLLSTLESKGIDHRLINQALQLMSGKKERSLPAGLPFPLIRQALLILIPIILLVALWFLAVPLFSGVSADCSYDKECFYNQANQCEESSVLEEIGSSILEYRSYSDCTITKQFRTFGKEEPEAVTRFFRGKQMVCKYPQGRLRKDIVGSLVGGIESCTGLLKDAVYELEYARLQLET